mmetsp:Transcript_2370/g.5142  ORF Transcript_2370/g.5142 Transcript_2370/m.5142 type:complete len:265 (-) Transcript_2370:824-1618(-)
MARSSLLSINAQIAPSSAERAQYSPEGHAASLDGHPFRRHAGVVCRHFIGVNVPTRGIGVRYRGGAALHNSSHALFVRTRRSTGRRRGDGIAHRNHPRSPDGLLAHHLLGHENLQRHPIVGILDQFPYHRFHGHLPLQRLLVRLRGDDQMERFLGLIPLVFPHGLIQHLGPDDRAAPAGGAGDAHEHQPRREADARGQHPRGDGGGGDGRDFRSLNDALFGLLVRFLPAEQEHHLLQFLGRFLLILAAFFELLRVVFVEARLVI